MTIVADAGGERAAAAAPGTSRWARASDLLNPILVREVQQAVKGRVFPLTILIALAISVVIATVVGANYVQTRTGRKAFDAGFATLIPLLVFVVPMQAYQSMRTELRGGIVEQLLLSRLTPSRVLAGKLLAAMVQFVLYVSVLSPLLATSYLLRGVDLPTIALSLGFALVACVAATAFAVSSAAQAVVPALQPVANLGIAFALGVATFATVGFVGSGQYTQAIGILLRNAHFGAVIAAIAMAALLTTTLSWLAARSFLLHAFENRSTAFRVFLFCVPVAVYGWMLAFVDPAARPVVFAGLTLMLLMTGVVFATFMVTEQRELSPRVRAHVPRGRAAAVLAAPFLPGRDRGMTCFLLYTGGIAAIAAVFWPSVTGPLAEPIYVWRIGALTIAYAMFYLGAGRWLRDRLPDTLQGNHAGRLVLPAMVFVGCVAPLLFDLFVRGQVDAWHPGHVLDPFWTIEYLVDDHWYTGLPFVVSAILVLVLLQVPSALRGVRAVAAAAAARRAAVPPPSSGP